MAQRFFFYFGLLMVLVFIALGIAVIVKGDYFFPNMTGEVRVFFGLLLIAYGSFRAYRYLAKPKSEE